MTIQDLLIGKTVSVDTDMKVKVELQIKSITRKDYSENLEESTRANDWWPKTRDWSKYEVTINNRATKTYDKLEDIVIVN